MASFPDDALGDTLVELVKKALLDKRIDRGDVFLISVWYLYIKEKPKSPGHKTSRILKQARRFDESLPESTSNAISRYLKPLSKKDHLTNESLIVGTKVGRTGFWEITDAGKSEIRTDSRFSFLKAPALGQLWQGLDARSAGNTRAEQWDVVRKFEEKQRSVGSHSDLISAFKRESEYHSRDSNPLTVPFYIRYLQLLAENKDQWQKSQHAESKVLREIAEVELYVNLDSATALGYLSLALQKAETTSNRFEAIQASLHLATLYHLCGLDVLLNETCAYINNAVPSAKKTHPEHKDDLSTFEDRVELLQCISLHSSDAVHKAEILDKKRDSKGTNDIGEATYWWRHSLRGIHEALIMGNLGRASEEFDRSIGEAEESQRGNSFWLNGLKGDAALLVHFPSGRWKKARELAKYILDSPIQNKHARLCAHSVRALLCLWSEQDSLKSKSLCDAHLQRFINEIPDVDYVQSPWSFMQTELLTSYHLVLSDYLVKAKANGSKASLDPLEIRLKDAWSFAKSRETYHYPIIAIALSIPLIKLETDMRARKAIFESTEALRDKVPASNNRSRSQINYCRGLLELEDDLDRAITSLSSVRDYFHTSGEMYEEMKVTLDLVDAHNRRGDVMKTDSEREKAAGILKEMMLGLPETSDQL